MNGIELQVVDFSCEGNPWTRCEFDVDGYTDASAPVDGELEQVAT